MNDIDRQSVNERRRRTAAMTHAGMTAAEIAKELGVTPRTVVRYRRDTGVAQPVPPRLSEEELSRAEQLLRDGVSIEEAARTIGRPGSGGLRTIFRRYAWTNEQAREHARLGQIMARLERHG